MKLSTIFQTTYCKIVTGAILAFAGIAGGIYTGLALGDKPDKMPERTASSEVQPFLAFKVGDLFPLEYYTSITGSTGKFGDLLKDRESIVLMVSLDCPPCQQLLRFWKTNMQSRLKAGVQVVAMVPRATGGIAPEYAGLFDGCTVTFHDREYWTKTYHHVFWPVIVGVDNSGFVTHIQFGFDGTIDFEIVQRFLVPAGSATHN
ncbi:hypothetical protein C3F09_01175 [candidate division GN15 bacterium]|uniref:Redoxin domain-containing protein n=1 Tax=candidate division GN15 bacterium TaxID=2072418 RepID=A0A855XCB9_9BACT|nr:MAG: hypothetical protein C3F09_01175 [candidate division GN15 bacterium]